MPYKVTLMKAQESCQRTGATRSLSYYPLLPPKTNHLHFHVETIKRNGLSNKLMGILKEIKVNLKMFKHNDWMNAQLPEQTGFTISRVSRPYNPLEVHKAEVPIHLLPSMTNCP